MKREAQLLLAKVRTLAVYLYLLAAPTRPEECSSRCDDAQSSAHKMESTRDVSSWSWLCNHSHSSMQPEALFYYVANTVSIVYQKRESRKILLSIQEIDPIGRFGLYPLAHCASWWSHRDNDSTIKTASLDWILKLSHGRSTMRYSPLLPHENHLWSHNKISGLDPCINTRSSSIYRSTTKIYVHSTCTSLALDVHSDDHVHDATGLFVHYAYGHVLGTLMYM